MLYAWRIIREERIDLGHEPRVAGLLRTRPDVQDVLQRSQALRNLEGVRQTPQEDVPRAGRRASKAMNLAVKKLHGSAPCGVFA